MSEILLRPLSKTEVVAIQGHRRRYERYARWAKNAMLACALMFVTSLIAIPAVSSAGDPLALVRQIMFVGALYNGLFFVFMIGLGVWLWGTYMAQSRAFVDEKKEDEKWISLISHERYQDLKAAQGGVFQFQFEEMKKRSRW